MAKCSFEIGISSGISNQNPSGAECIAFQSTLKDFKIEETLII